MVLLGKQPNKKLSVNVLVIELRNIRHNRGSDIKDDASSSENSTPPIGAPKAAATPAAQPAETKSRLTRSVFRLFGPKLWLRFAATQEPECTSGPSLPTQSPPATLKLTPNAFTTKAFIVRKPPAMLVPFKYDFASGIPLPAAAGSTYATRHDATATNAHAKLVDANQA